MIIDLVDKLADRVIQLVTHRKQKRADLLENCVAPVFAEFEQVHAAYLESFVRYRELIQGTKGPDWIPALRAMLEKDNLFSAHSRTKIVRLAQSPPEGVLKPFEESVCDYLVHARLVDSLGKEALPGDLQRWRQSFLRKLGEIADERWQCVIDAEGARPPLNPDEMHEALEQRRAKYPMEGRARSKQDALKRSCALWALDEIVLEMQHRYDAVCRAYAELRETLSK